MPTLPKAAAKQPLSRKKREKKRKKKKREKKEKREKEADANSAKTRGQTATFLSPPCAVYYTAQQIYWTTLNVINGKIRICPAVN